MGKPVAVLGDVKAEVSTTDLPSAKGSWVAGPVVDVPNGQLSHGDKKVIKESSCVFTYTGANTSTGAPVPGSETVTLKAGATTITNKGAVLLDGDEAVGPAFSNKLSVKASQKILTTS
ncbi:hypothetical protein [Teredinibacter purpureus]|jgi:hypothetical protein|uniref:hypothetical protein n=1 Tax=Teredinibacter purpureus TaxID=2731756 RepID=UPI0005F783A8|nr:hypothetical protein [Teredinibacter purpureus]